MRPVNSHILTAFSKGRLINRGYLKEHEAWIPEDEVAYVVKGITYSVHENEIEGHSRYRTMSSDHWETGDLINTAAIFENGAPVNLNVLSGTIISLMPARIIRKRMQSESELAIAMLDQLSHQQKRSREYAEDERAPMPLRVPRVLSRLAQTDYAKPHPKGVSLRLTKQSLGRMLNGSREHVGAILNTLADMGLIEYEKGHEIVLIGDRA